MWLSRNPPKCNKPAIPFPVYPLLHPLLIPKAHTHSHRIPHLLSSNQTLDIAHYGWGAAAGWAGVDLDKFPAVQAWLDRMEAREGVEKGRHVPDPHTMRELLKDKAKMEEQAAKSRAWVQAGMKDDAERQK